MKLDAIVKRIDEIISHGQNVLSTTQDSDYGKYVDDGLFYGFRTSSLSFLSSTFGARHPYYIEFNEQVKSPNPYDTTRGAGILVAARNELAGGWVFTTKGLVSAEIFSDFLDMANYLLSEKYKDPAAVIVGSVLEEHLRQLANKHGLQIEVTKDGKQVPKKADTLNAELAAANAYSKLDQKSITAWLDLRNKAAHGKYSEYTLEQVQLMNQAVTDFMSRVPV